MLERELEVAREAVRAACRACAHVRRDVDVGRLEKDDRSPVTLADYASQAVAAHALSEVFPEDPLVAEEGSAALRAEENRVLLKRVAGVVRARPDEVVDWIDRGSGTPSPRFWTLDPVDGTKGFLRNGQYAVALALIEHGTVVLGVLGCPNLPARGDAPSADGDGTILWAVRKRGAYQEPVRGGEEASPVRVGREQDLTQARLCESFESAHSRHDLSDEAARRLGIRANPVRVDSQAKYALVARGDAEVYWRLPTRPGYEEKIWDHAAGSLIVEEAGGAVSDVFGRALDFSQGRTLAANRGVLATHGPFHRDILRELSRHLPPE